MFKLTVTVTNIHRTISSACCMNLAACFSLKQPSLTNCCSHLVQVISPEIPLSASCFPKPYISCRCPSRSYGVAFSKLKARNTAVVNNPSAGWAARRSFMQRFSRPCTRVMHGVLVLVSGCLRVKSVAWGWDSIAGRSGLLGYKKITVGLGRAF